MIYFCTGNSWEPRPEGRKKGKFVISSHASSRINPRIIDRIATALKREQKSTRVTMNRCCSRVWTMWAQRPSGLSTRTSTRRGSTAIGSPWRIWKVSYLFFFFYKPCTGHVMDTTSIVQFPYPSLCLLPKEKKRRRRRKVKVLSLLILFTLVAAASISDSCPPYVGQFFFTLLHFVLRE